MLVFKHSDLDLTAKQHRYSAAINDRDYAQNNYPAWLNNRELHTICKYFYVLITIKLLAIS